MEPTLSGAPELAAGFGPGRPVPRVRGELDFAVFRRNHQRPARPVLLEGMADGWPARAWTLQGLRERFGERVVPLVQVDDGLLCYAEGKGMDYHARPLGEFIDGVLAGDPDWFLMLRPEDWFPVLLDELLVPGAMRRARWRDVRVTVGPRGAVTPIHREFFDNLFGLFAGGKQVALFPPADARRLHAHGVLSGIPHISPVDPRRVDDVRFPGARDCVPWRVTMRPGDVLYIPRGWWHTLATTAPAIGAGHWWAEGPRAALPVAARVYKALLGVRT